jgi:hypothetical protein
MRLLDQPAVLVWPELKSIGRHLPIEVIQQHKRFETVAAAVDFATSILPETFRPNAMIETKDVTLRWADIEAMGEATGRLASTHG